MHITLLFLKSGFSTFFYLAMTNGNNDNTFLYFYWIDTYPLFSSVFLGGWQWPLRLLHVRFELGEAYSKKGPLRICQFCKATFWGTSHTEPVWIMRESLELFKSDKRNVGRIHSLVAF